MRILFLHPAASFGGASKSLCELASQLISPELDIHVICPFGKAAESFQAVGMIVHPVRGLSQLDNTRYGHYRGWRWLVLLREIALFPGSIAAILKARRENQFDLIHINEITLLLLGLIAKKMLGVPLIVHVRSLQHSKGRITRWISSRLREDADAVIAIDETVKRTLPEDIRVEVIHNGLAVTKDVNPLKEHIFRIGIVGLLLKLKGVYEFVEAARVLLKERNVKAEFWIVGENSRPVRGIKGWLLQKFDFATDVHQELKDFIQFHNLQKSILLKGFQADVQSIYRELDVLCFPSHLDAAGRPVFEAAFFNIPSIVAIRNAPSDTIVHGHTGLCIKEPTPLAIANAIEYLYMNHDECKQMGHNAFLLAQRNFNVSRNAESILSLYQRLLEK